MSIILQLIDNLKFRWNQWKHRHDSFTDQLDEFYDKKRPHS